MVPSMCITRKDVRPVNVRLARWTASPTAASIVDPVAVRSIDFSTDIRLTPSRRGRGFSEDSKREESSKCRLASLERGYEFRSHMATSRSSHPAATATFGHEAAPCDREPPPRRGDPRGLISGSRHPCAADCLAHRRCLSLEPSPPTSPGPSPGGSGCSATRLRPRTRHSFTRAPKKSCLTCQNAPNVRV
jgi:hypothetical protein